LLATMSLPAFALHTFLELADADDQLIRTTVGGAADLLRAPAGANGRPLHGVQVKAISSKQ
jgi:hypothetical protein